MYVFDHYKANFLKVVLSSNSARYQISVPLWLLAAKSLQPSIRWKYKQASCRYKIELISIPTYAYSAVYVYDYDMTKRTLIKLAFEKSLYE